MLQVNSLIGRNYHNDIAMFFFWLNEKKTLFHREMFRGHIISDIYQIYVKGYMTAMYPSSVYSLGLSPVGAT